MCITGFNILNTPTSFSPTIYRCAFLKMPNAKLNEFLHCTPNSLLPFKPNRTVSTTVFSLFCPIQYTIHKISVISHTRKKHVSAEARPGFSDRFHFFSPESVDIVNTRILAQKNQKQICNKNWTGLGLIRFEKVEANNDSGFVSKPNQWKVTANLTYTYHQTSSINQSHLLKFKLMDSNIKTVKEEKRVCTHGQITNRLQS